MTMHQQTLLLFLGIGILLSVASLIGWALARRAGDKPSPVVENLNARIKAWWVMVALIGLSFLAGKTGVILLFAFASFAALREFLTITDTRRADHYALAAMFFVALPVQYYLLWIEWYGLYAIFIPVYGFLILPIIAALRGDTTRYMERVAEMQWGMMICIFCLSHVPALLTLTIPGYEGRGLLLVAFLVIVVQSSDVLQYVWGKLYGRHKVAPNLSPSKTWEGLIGGVASAVLLGTSLWWITPFSPLQAAGLSLVITLMGFFGGLVMSAIKRDRGVKDWGRMIEGHGGMLDRLDSVIFAAPIFFHLVRYWWTV
ncbi:phosphatidate cytidylyltransferase [Chthonobacter albigriseus]|uniref:phosphatidate cytidylyltransferase n=1 Tax=Chthonobacter albigriseus TaxID=1683161 RepID=UPI0015EEDC40|nr:phosphatidate cytidylyltransferase [Chthonobacter albigriseus]